MKPFAPMLASKADLDSMRFPLFGSPKLDGIRAVTRNGDVLSRKLLQIPNVHVRRMLIDAKIDCLDGELIVGSPTADNVYRATNSAVMSFTGEPEFTFFVFDIIGLEASYAERYARLKKLARRAPYFIRLHDQTILNNRIELDAFEKHCVDLGYEGIITRHPDSPYKHGRSTAKEQYLLKIKRFEDSEAEVLHMIEEMQNTNEAGRDELGRTKRSKMKAGLVGKGTMGALYVRDLKTGIEFKIGGGFTAADRQREWKPGTIVTYKHFPVGVKEKPRHPIYKGERSRIDL